MVIFDFNSSSIVKIPQNFVIFINISSPPFNNRLSICKYLNGLQKQLISYLASNIEMLVNKQSE